jgi:hypothetical protein
VTFDPSNPIGCVFADVIDKPAWNVRKGHGSFLTFEFGEPRLEIGKPMKIEPQSERLPKSLRRRPVAVRGEWHLWIYCCHWQATYEGELVGHSGSPRSEVEAAAHMFNGQALASMTVDPAKGASQFVFDLGGILKTVPYRTGDDEESWMLFTPDGRVLVYRSDGHFSLHARDADPRKAVWLPLTAPQKAL